MALSVGGWLPWVSAERRCHDIQTPCRARGNRARTRGLWRSSRPVFDRDAVDDRVDRGRGGPGRSGDRSIVAAAEFYLGTIRWQALTQLCQELELAHLPTIPDKPTLQRTKVRTDVESRQPFLHRVGEAGSRVGKKPPRSRKVRLALQIGLALMIFGFLVLTVIAVVVTVQVAVPTKLAPEARSAVEAFRDATAGEDPRAGLHDGSRAGG